MARIASHYFINKGFVKQNQLIDDLPRIKNIPGVIVHGRYDMICSANNAWLLHKAWPNSKLYFIRDAGHSSGEPGIVDELVRATNEFGNAFS